MKQNAVRGERQCSTLTVFVRSVRSACLSESEHVREDAETDFDSVVRVPVPNARLNLRREAADLSAHVSAAQTKTARGRGMRSRFSIPGRAVRLCHMAKGPSGGAFGLRWSLPAPVPRRDIKSETRSVSYLFSLREGKDKSLRRTHKKRPPLLQQSFVCGRRDLNPYGMLHTPLKRARLPVPPLPHTVFRRETL